MSAYLAPSVSYAIFTPNTISEGIDAQLEAVKKLAVKIPVETKPLLTLAEARQLSGLSRQYLLQAIKEKQMNYQTMTTKPQNLQSILLLGGCTGLAMLKFIHFLVVTTEDNRILYQVLIP